MILNEPAAQKEAFNLANLLTNVNPYNLIKPKVVNDYLLSIVMAKELAKISLNLSKPDIHALKKSLPLCGNTVYGYKAPHKTGAGIGLPLTIEAIHDAPASFFVSAHTHTLSMVGCMGLPSGRLVSLIASKANSVQSTASKIGLLGGGYKPSIKEAATCWLLPLPQNRNLSGLSPQFAAIARQLPPKFIILLPSLNAMLAVLWCAITSAFLLVVSAWRWHMIKTYDVHMDPLERTSQIITLTEVINDILVSNSPSRDERLKALLAILDLAVRDVHFLLEGGQMPCKTGATNE